MAQKNPNHPKKGSLLTVEPIKQVKNIKAIKALLATKPRDLALFVLGINTNLRASDLIGLKVSQVQGVKAGEDLVLKEKKTGKQRRITLNKACVEAVRNLLASRSCQPDDYLFLGQRGPITAIYVNHLVKRWTTAINLKGRFGAHTLRKTWGYHQRVTFGSDIPTLMTCYNHSSQRQTLDYLCIQPEEIKNVYENCL
ncbi:MAG: tyrosine-type recombinase/integrase [Proteobacteria bacterium]|nr:tyrosine-type recombinase/integrase [Pseudomonadota bacterium]